MFELADLKNLQVILSVGKFNFTAQESLELIKLIDRITNEIKRLEAPAEAHAPANLDA